MGKGSGKGGYVKVYTDDSCTGIESNLIYRENNGKTVGADREQDGLNAPKPTITMDELAKHDKPDDLWVAIEGKAYNLTTFKLRHPGGFLPLEGVAGRNATEPFENFHPAPVWKLLKTYHVADVADWKQSEYVKGHREIRQILLEQGLFETKPSYYATKALCLGSLLSIAIVLALCCQSAAAHMLGAALIGFFWQQLSFVGHDIGHNAITHKRGLDYAIGVANVALVGISIGWWKKSHNTHHVVCNSVEHDPDIQHLPVMAVSPEALQGFMSTYHKKVFKPLLLDPVAHAVVCYQHYLYYVIMFFARVNLYVQSFAHLLNFNQKVEYRWGELAAFAAFFGWFGALVAQMNTTAEMVGFVLIAHGVSGLLHVQITLSHFCMEVWSKDKKVYTDDSNDWFRMQIATTMDVTCPEWLDWLHGGLQFQIEHHLFPRVPRHNLRKVRDLVKAHCKKHDIYYHEVSFLQGNCEVIAGLRETALAARKLSAADAMALPAADWIAESANLRG